MIKKLFILFLLFSSIFLFGCSLFNKNNNNNGSKAPINQNNNNTDTTKNIDNGKINVYVDSKCTLEICKTETISNVITQELSFSGNNINYIDLSLNTELISGLNELGVNKLPLIEFTKNQYDELNNSQHEAAKYVQNKDGRYFLFFYFWEAGKENICDDGIDNDANGLIDDKDPNCKPAVLVTDSRCTANDSELCDTGLMINQLKTSIFPVGYSIKIIDYFSDDGKKFYEKVRGDSTNLPIITTSFLEQNILESLISQGLVNDIDVDGQKYLLKLFQASWDPIKVDNCYLDGKPKCELAECSTMEACIPEEKGKLELFIMGYCPFGELAANGVKDILNQFKDDNINIVLNYISSHTGQGVEIKDFQSLHGDPETEENIRQLCIIKNYGTEKIADYFLLRYKNADNYGKVSDDPKIAIEGIGADLNKINNCISSGEGGQLLLDNIKRSQQLNVSGSPTWYANGKYKFGGYDTGSVIQKFCQYNQDLKGCQGEINIDNSTNSTGSEPQCGN